MSPPSPIEIVREADGAEMRYEAVGPPERLELLPPMDEQEIDELAARDGARTSGGVGLRLALPTSVLSVALFGFGLVAPLTPSYGCPTVLELAVFGVLPPVLAAGGSLVVGGLLRWILGAQALLTAGAAAWLLVRIGCL